MTTTNPLPSGKEPWLAVNLALFFPGLGHFYTGNILRGLCWLVVQILLWIGWGWLALYADVSPILLAFGLLFNTLGMGLLSLFDTYHCARLKNSVEFEQLRKQYKDPWLAVFFSRFIPGAGHLYANKVPLGIFLVLLWIVGFFLPILAILSFLLLPFIAFLAYRSVPNRRQGSDQFIGWIAIALVLFPILVSLPLIFGVRTFVAEARYTPSEAMLPTLEVGDRFIVDKLTYHLQKPQRGDLIIFMPNKKLQQEQPTLKDAFIKRVIGLPGEKVEVKQGKVYINDQSISEPYINATPDYEWGSEMVPADAYFVLGDNRNNSYDSHFWGYVPRSLIIGKATKIFYPFNRSRIFTATNSPTLPTKSDSAPPSPP
jgi:signal peptidase I